MYFRAAERVKAASWVYSFLVAHGFHTSSPGAGQQDSRVAGLAPEAVFLCSHGFPAGAGHRSVSAKVTLSGAYGAGDLHCWFSQMCQWQIDIVVNIEYFLLLKYVFTNRTHSSWWVETENAGITKGKRPLIHPLKGKHGECSSRRAPDMFLCVHLGRRSHHLNGPLFPRLSTLRHTVPRITTKCYMAVWCIIIIYLNQSSKVDLQAVPYFSQVESVLGQTFFEIHLLHFFSFLLICFWEWEEPWFQ